jgi:hypothetical protein
VATQNGSKRRRLDHNLYAAEGVVVIGAVVFLFGFGIEKSSNTPGRALEAAGFVIFALGLFASAAIGYYLSRHYARTTADPLAQDPSALADVARPQFGYLSTRLDPVGIDPTASLVREVQADPENDITRARLIERERPGDADGGQPFAQ